MSDMENTDAARRKGFVIHENNSMLIFELFLFFFAVREKILQRHEKSSEFDDYQSVTASVTN